MDADKRRVFSSLIRVHLRSSAVQITPQSAPIAPPHARGAATARPAPPSSGGSHAGYVLLEPLLLVSRSIQRTVLARQRLAGEAALADGFVRSRHARRGGQVLLGLGPVLGVLAGAGLLLRRRRRPGLARLLVRGHGGSLLSKPASHATTAVGRLGTVKPQ